MRMLCLWWLSVALAAAADPALVEKTTVPLSSVERVVPADLFATDFLQGDSNYHSITETSDGKIHFTVNSHDTAFGCHYYVFDPKTESMTLAGKLDEVLGEPAAEWVPQGKVHVPLVENKGRVWFATHTAYYDGELPRRDTQGRKPYAGGHFVSYDLATGTFTDLAKVMPGEGIITMAMDKPREILYGLTWPSGLLVSYEIEAGELSCWGAVQGRGEWGQHPREWDRICRTLGVDPQGRVYGSTMDGRIWQFDPKEARPVSYLDGLDLSRLPFSQSAAETVKGDFQHNWRVIEWDPATNGFWGVTWETTTLFQFLPEKAYLRSVAELRPEAYRGMPRNPEISQLGFALGPRHTVFYLAHGPAVDIPDRPPAQSGLYLITYGLDDGRLVNHGPVMAEGNRRVFFSESLAFGPDDRLYSVAWVEITDPARIEEVRRARRAGPAETRDMTYEMMLVRLPAWQKVLDVPNE